MKHKKRRFWAIWLVVVLFLSADMGAIAEQRDAPFSHDIDWYIHDYPEGTPEDLMLLDIVLSAGRCADDGVISTLTELEEFIQVCLSNSFGEDYCAEVQEPFEDDHVFLIWLSEHFCLYVLLAPDTNHARNWEEEPLEHIPETEEEFMAIANEMECPPGDISAIMFYCLVPCVDTNGDRRNSSQQTMIYEWNPVRELERIVLSTNPGITQHEIPGNQ